MPGTIVLLTVEESEVGAEFVSIQRDSKKTVLKFNVKRDTKDKINKLYPFAGENVAIILEQSQMSIDDFYEEPHEGVEYNVNPDGTTNVVPGQLNIDDEETIAH